MSEDMCPRVGALWRSCYFKPRYDTYTPSMELKQVIARQWNASPKDREMLREETIYVQDVCQTCGKVIKRCED